MKSFLEEYGFAILAAIVVILLIAMCTPVGSLIKKQVMNVIDNFASKSESRLSNVNDDISVVLNQSDVSKIEVAVISKSTTDQFDVEYRVKVGNTKWEEYKPLGEIKDDSSKMHKKVFDITANDKDQIQVRVVDPNKKEKIYYESNIITYLAAFVPSGSVEDSNVTGNYITFSSPESFTVALSAKTWDGSIEYSTDAVNWTVYDIANTAIESVNNKLYFRGTGNSRIALNPGQYSSFVLTGTDIACSGNIETLLDYQTVVNGGHPTMADYALTYLFNNCISLTSAPALPATTLTQYCYFSMFQNCTSLTTAPALPATTLAKNCYQNMFYYCTSLTTAPALPATTLADSCYKNMFLGCRSLTTAPALPATTLANYCYETMFAGCTKLKVSSSQTGSYTIPYRIPTSGTGTTASNALNNMFTDTGGTFTGTPGINITYYLDNSNSIVQ